MSRLFFLAVLTATPVVAQVAGSLTGKVVDPSGAIVPGATVGVYLAGGKAPLISGKTNSAGIFAFNPVQPETYRVAIDATGFGRMELAGVKVDPLQEKDLGAIKLTVQSASQVVEVTTEVQSVQLTNAEASNTITNEQVEN